VGDILLFLTIILNCSHILLQAHIFKGVRADLNGARHPFLKIISEKGVRVITKVTALTATTMIIITYVYLTALFITDSFNYQYVQNHSSNAEPLFLKISAVWAGQEGSLLLFILIVSLCKTFCVFEKDHAPDAKRSLQRWFGLCLFPKNYKLSAVVFVVTVLETFLLGYLLIVNDPFVVTAASNGISIQGHGINPVLKSLWMIIHPPLLFAGYAASIIFAVKSIVELYVPEKSGLSDRWLSASIIFMGAGIASGGYWAYKVLGWGGYWGWDPVENSSLLIWLMLVAKVHTELIVRRFNSCKLIDYLVSVFILISVFLSMFVTRSGILSEHSVHSFGSGSTAILLAVPLIASSIIPVIIFYKKRLLFLVQKASPKMSFNEILLTICLYSFLFLSFVILLGTFLPILSSTLFSSTLVAGKTFYNKFSMLFNFSSLLIILIITAKKYLRYYIMIPPVVILCLIVNIPLITSFVIGLGLSAITAMLAGNKSKSLSFILFHIGYIILAVGIAFSYNPPTERLTMKANEIFNFDDKQILFTGNFHDNLNFIINGSSRFSIPYYFDDSRKQFYKEPLVISGLLSDLYIIPERYLSAKEVSGLRSLTVNEIISFEEISIKFHGIIKPDENSISKNNNFSADLTVYKNEEKENLLLPTQINKTDDNSYVDSSVANRKIYFRNFDHDNSALIVWIEPLVKTDAPDILSVEISKVWNIVLVWLGAVIIIMGGVVKFFDNLYISKRLKF